MPLFAEEQPERFRTKAEGRQSEVSPLRGQQRRAGQSPHTGIYLALCYSLGERSKKDIPKHSLTFASALLTSSVTSKMFFIGSIQTCTPEGWNEVEGTIRTWITRRKKVLLEVIRENSTDTTINISGLLSLVKGKDSRVGNTNETQFAGRSNKMEQHNKDNKTINREKKGKVISIHGQLGGNW